MRNNLIPIIFGSLIFLLFGCDLKAPSKAPPQHVELKSLDLLSYNLQFVSLQIKGELTAEGVTSENPVHIYSNKDCAGQPAGIGTQAQFQTNGISVQVPSVGASDLYVSGVSFSGCYFLTTFTPNFGVPVNPVFRNSVPASPTRESFTPVLFGDHSVSGFTVNFFSDTACSVPLGSTTTEDLRGNGYRINLQSNALSSIYVQVVEPFGQKSLCEKFLDYQHSNTGPASPLFLSSSPVSPSGASTTPLLQGSVEAGTTEIRFFSDVLCSEDIGSGDRAEFESQGVAVTIAPNTQTQIYAVGLDSQGAPSRCELFTIYRHDDVPPSGPTFESASPVSPTRVTLYPTFKGTLPSDATSIRFFKNSNCTDQIGSGTKMDYAGTGATVSVPANSTSNIYGAAVDEAENLSTCTLLTSYRHNTIPPDPPVYDRTDPISPNNFSTTPRILGNAAERTVELKFFSDEDCLVQIGVGAGEDYGTVGIPIVLPENAITTVYATARDEEGNISACSVQGNYAHSTLPAPVPGFFGALPASPTRTTNQPYLIGTADVTITKVDVYTDSSCFIHAGSASRVAFVSSGVRVTLPTNAITDIYAISTDVYGNTSPCSLLTSYTHNTIPPFNPTFSSISPLSPNNFSISPVIVGGTTQDPLSVLPPATVGVYDSFLCLNRLGLGTAAQFNGTGVSLGVSENASTSLYAKVFDAAGNGSACTSMTTYIHDSYAPGKPQYSSATPATPSYTPVTKIVGTFGPTQDFLPVQDVKLYSNSGCTNLLATGTPTQFQSGGIEITVPLNAITSIFGRATNIVTTQSTCEFLINYRHTDVGATNLNATLQPDGSVNITWTPDSVSSPLPTYTVKRSTTSGGPYTVIQSNLTGSSYRDRSVTFGATYYYVVSASNITGTSKDTSERTVTITSADPDQPASLFAVAGAAQVSLSWVGFPQNMYYRVFRSTAQGGPYQRIGGDLTSMTYIDLSPTNGVPYYYKVIGTNSKGVSIESNEANAVPLTTPSGPTNLKAEAVLGEPACGGTLGIHLSWSPPAYFQGFNVRFGLGNFGSPTPIGSVTSPYFVHCPTTADVLSYDVTAIWGSGESPASNIIRYDATSAIFLTAYPGDGHVLVDWTSDPSALSYTVEKSPSPLGPFDVLIANTGNTNYLDTSVSNGTGYFYRVYGNYSFTRKGIYTPVVSAVPGPNPGPPSLLTLTFNAGGFPSLAWVGPTGANGFRVYRSANPGGPFTEIGFALVNSYTDNAPANGLNYYQVRSAWGTYNSSESNTVGFRRANINGFSVTAGAGQIDLSWASVAGASGYSVFRSDTPGGPYLPLNTTVTPSFADTTAVAGVGYFYVVRADFPDASFGNLSAELSGMKTGSMVPAGLGVVSATNSQIVLRWARVTGASNYKIYKSTSPGGPFNLDGTVGSNSYTAGLLAGGTRYYFKVSSLASSTESALSPAVDGWTYATPLTPSVIPGTGSVVVSWAMSTGATSYSVLRSTDGLNFSTLASGLSTFSFNDTTAVNGVLYYYRVVSVYPPFTRESSSSPGVVPGGPPPVPAGLMITQNLNGTDVLLSFAKSEGATGYNMYLATSPGGPYAAPITVSGTSDHLIAGLTPATVYYVAIASLKGSTESAKSSDLAFIPWPQSLAPTVYSPSSTQINLTWTGVPGASTYKIFRSEDEINYREVASGLVGTSYTDNTVVAGKHYKYLFLPINAGGVSFSRSAPSLLVTPGVLPNYPLNFIAESTSTPSAKLNWVASSNTSSYNIYRSPAGLGTYALVTNLLFPATTYEDTSVVLGSSYDYVIRSLSPYGTESANSNVASVTLADAPTGLGIVPANGRLTVSWNPVGGAISYKVRRRVGATTDYAVIASGVTGTSHIDTSVLDGVTYHYVVQAVFSGGVTSLNSSESSAVAVRKMNLVVPVEMIDRGIASLTSPVLFQRSRVSVEPGAYDGIVSYFFEIFASNGEGSSYDVELVDQSSNVLGVITVPSNGGSPERLRVPISSPTVDGYVQIRMPATVFAGSLQIYSASLLIHQTAASKTKIYFPLMSASSGPTAEDEFGFIEEFSGTTLAAAASSSVFAKASNSFSNILSYNAYEFEAIASRTGIAEASIGLYNTTTSQIVNYSQTQIKTSGMKWIRASFGEGTTQFGSANEGHEYQIGLRCEKECQSGGIRVHKAGLWIRVNQLTKAIVPFRLSHGQMLSSGQVMNTHRTRINLADFSNPMFLIEATAKTMGLGFKGLNLIRLGADDQSLLGQSIVSDSYIEYSSSEKARIRTVAPMSLISDDRYTVGRDVGTGSLIVNDSQLLIFISN